MLVAKLSKNERSMLRESRDGCAYALSSSINARKPYMANSFQSSMQTIQSSNWYNSSQSGGSHNEIFRLIVPRIPLSKFCQSSIKQSFTSQIISSPVNSSQNSKQNLGSHLSLVSLSLLHTLCNVSCVKGAFLHFSLKRKCDCLEYGWSS